MNKQVLDPVCGMTVNPETAAGQTEYQGKTYYFCSPGCKVAFEKEPLTSRRGQSWQHISDSEPRDRTRVVLSG